jgi:hypothetical protein
VTLTNVRCGHGWACATDSATTPTAWRA